MNAKPGAEHQWLQRLVGEWSFETVADAEPGKPSAKMTGTESVRSIDGMWVLCEGRGDAGECSMGSTVMTLGFDPAKGKYVGTFIGSTMPFLWIYEGALADAGARLALSAAGPSFAVEGAMANYRDTIEFVDDDHRILSSEIEGEGGVWRPFMKMHYRRQP